MKALGSQPALCGSDYRWTPAPGVTAQVASVDSARNGIDWRALTSAKVARLFPRLAG